MHRFFVPPTWIQSGIASLEGDVAHRVGRVLHMSAGDEVILLDNSGNEYRVKLTRFDKQTVVGEVLSVDEGRGEPVAKVTLYQGLLKGEKFQWVLQKGTELGVTTFVPLICQRSIPQKKESWFSTRQPRWNKIIIEAAEQSGRCVLPELGEPKSFQDACGGIESTGVSIIPWEQEEATGLRSLLQSTKPLTVNIFIGPEGGFEETEVAYCRSFGVVPVSLGRRILRAETAGIAAVAAVQYEGGEMGN